MVVVTMKPIITEKSMRLASSGTYMFDVNPTANKPMIVKAAKEQFKVDAINVRISILKGKEKRLKGIVGTRSDRKRAYVTVKKGQKISVFEITEEEKK